MNPNEMIKMITENEWCNTNSKEVCSFSWGEKDQSMNIEFKTGERAGKRDSHKLVKVYLTKGDRENCTGLSFQSNLFTSEFILCPESGHLMLNSQVFGDMELEKI